MQKKRIRKILSKIPISILWYYLSMFYMILFTSGINKPREITGIYASRILILPMEIKGSINRWYNILTNFSSLNSPLYFVLEVIIPIILTSVLMVLVQDINNKAKLLRYRYFFYLLIASVLDENTLTVIIIISTETTFQVAIKLINKVRSHKFSNK